MIFNYFLILIMLLLAGGLALDTGMLQWRLIHAQNAADAAALEGMYQHSRGDGSWVSEGQAQSATNGFTNGSNNVTVSLSNPPSSGTYAGDSFAVQATVSQTVNNIFMGLVGGGKSVISATATAREIPTCIWIMNPTNTSTSGGSLWVASASMVANCGLYINTSSGQSMTIDGFGALGTLRTRIVGSLASNTSSGYVSPHPRYGSVVKTDPLAYVTAPTWSTCTYTGISLSGFNGTVGPATYCGGLTMSNSNVTLAAGTYIIAGGLSVSNSTISGTGVTLYFTKTSASPSYSTINLSNATVSLTAPTNTASGGIPGVLMFADRNWVAHGTAGMNVQYSNIKSDGVWYFPNVGLYFWSNTVNYYTYTGWVVDNVYEFGSSIYFNTNYANLGGVSPYHYDDGVLVQ